MAKKAHPQRLNMRRGHGNPVLNILLRCLTSECNRIKDNIVIHSFWSHLRDHSESLKVLYPTVRYCSMTTCWHELPLNHLFYVFPVLNEVVVHIKIVEKIGKALILQRCYRESTCCQSTYTERHMWDSVNCAISAGRVANTKIMIMF